MTISLQRCPYCHDPLRPEAAKAGCHRCLAWHHAECLADHGRCAACGAGAATGAERIAGAVATGPIRFQLFRSSWDSWETLLQNAASLATKLGPERVVSVSHSSDSGDGVVTVWYRAADATGQKPALELRFLSFQSAWDSWEVLHQRAADQAARLAPGSLLGISHSCDNSTGLIVVWFWDR